MCLSGFRYPQLIQEQKVVEGFELEMFVFPRRWTDKILSFLVSEFRKEENEKKNQKKIEYMKSSWTVVVNVLKFGQTISL